MGSFLKSMCSFGRGICWTTSNKCCPFRTAVSVGQEVVGQHVFGKCVPGGFAGDHQQLCSLGMEFAGCYKHVPSGQHGRFDFLGKSLLDSI